MGFENRTVDTIEKIVKALGVGINDLMRQIMKTGNHLLAKIGQYALIRNSEGHLLVLERARSKTWSLPGGRLNNFEAWDTAFIREIKEESNLDVIEIKPFAINVLTDHYQVKYCVYFNVSVKNSNDIKISPEHSNFKWIGLSEITKIKFEDEQVLKVISDFLNIQMKFIVSTPEISMDEKREIIDIKGNKKQLGCLSCAIQNGEVESPGGSIASTQYFDAHQDYEIPIPGFVILVSKRHLQSVDEFTPEERTDFIEFLYRLRKTMRQACDVRVVYLIQEEDTSHHFHVWMFPRYDWLVEKFGRKIQSVRPIMEFARENMKTPENLKKVDEATEKMKKYFHENFVAKEQDQL